MEPQELELKLKRALEAEDPPDDFADSVLRRCIEQRAEAAGRISERHGTPERIWSWHGWFPRSWRLALAGGLAVSILGVGIGWRQHQERVRGEQARAQLMLALQITGKQIHRVHNVLVEQQGGVQE